MKEKTLGDMIFSTIKDENPIDKGNEILFDSDEERRGYIIEEEEKT